MHCNIAVVLYVNQGMFRLCCSTKLNVSFALAYSSFVFIIIIMIISSMPLVKLCCHHKVPPCSQHDSVLAATRCADQYWQVSGRFQQFESISVLVALEVFSSLQAVLELQHV